jgi:hypothetical protein
MPPVFVDAMRKAGESDYSVENYDVEKKLSIGELHVRFFKM